MADTGKLAPCGHPEGVHKHYCDEVVQLLNLIKDREVHIFNLTRDKQKLIGQFKHLQQIMQDTEIRNIELTNKVRTEISHGE